MSKKQWMVLLMLFLTYLLLGASIFYHIESRLEVEKVKKAREERIEINALLNLHYMPNDPVADHHQILQKLSSYCGKSFHNYSEGETDQLKWDFYNSFYFAYTVVSTIGYGNLAPTNMLGRILMIFYGLIGIPMNGILLSQLGEFFGQVFVKAHKKYKSYQQDHNDCQKKHNTLETRKAGLAMQIFMYLIPGFVMFIFFPAFLFSHYEGWSYDEAVYYAFVTLTTIGFGDYVAGQDNTKGSGVLFILYKTFLICWISFGLGYIVMIMTFIARGMRSKKIARIEHKLAMNLKHTQSKIWNEFNKELSYFRRVFNELQLSKVKRVYVDEYDYDTPTPKFSRSNSFPDLRELIYGGLEIPEPPCPRRRANSEVVPLVRVARVVSETDLQRIDKNATFATHAMVQPAELLARLVNILGYIPPPDDEEETETKEGIQGFSEKEILASEAPWHDSEWILGGDKISYPKPRSRACSEVRLEKPDTNYLQENGEWTWSGPTASSKLQEMIKSHRSTVKDFKSKFPSIALPKSVQKSFLPRWMRNLSNKKSSEDYTRSTVSVGEIDERDREALQSQMIRNHSSRTSTTRPYFTHTGAGNTGLEGLLEETSLADFIRALTRVGAPEDFSMKPQRKMGTASLTPPKLPSLFTLFSQHSDLASASQSQQNTITAAHNAASRRFSLRTVENSGTSTPIYSRRSFAQPPPVTKGRRFSLRPVVTPIGTAQYTSPYSGNQTEPPPYTNEFFNVECPKEPLMQLEGAPGVSAPISTSTGARRFSLRPAQLDNTPTSPATSVSLNPQLTQQTRVLPRWKAGMLQRQISKKNLQRRVRAFSLSDVHSDATDRNTGISPLAFDKSRTVTTLVGQKEPSKFIGRTSTSAFQKTVTIVSPQHKASSSRASDSKQGSSCKRGYSESEAEPETSWDNASQFYKESSSKRNPFDEFSKSSSESQSLTKNPFAFKLGSDDYETSPFSETSKGVVNPRFAALKTYPSSQGATKLATVYSDDRLSCQDTDQSDDSFTSECVIALKKKSTGNLQDLDRKTQGRQSSRLKMEPSKKEPSGEISKPTQSTDSAKGQETLSAKSGDEKTSERKVSIVSIEPWSDSSTRASTNSQTPTGGIRKSLEVQSPKLFEVKVEKAASFSDKFKATIELGVDEEGSLTEVKVEEPKASALGSKSATEKSCSK